MGLRYPTTADGRPIVVQLRGLQGWLDDRDVAPTFGGAWVVDAIGRDGSMAGVRDLTILGRELHVVTGNIDSRQKGSVLLEDHPEGRDTVSNPLALRSALGPCRWRGRCRTGRRVP